MSVRSYTLKKVNIFKKSDTMNNILFSVCFFFYGGNNWYVCTYTFIIILSKSELKIHISSRTDGENGLRMIAFRMLSNNIRTFWLTFHSWKPLLCFSKYEYFFSSNCHYRQKEFSKVAIFVNCDSKKIFLFRLSENIDHP